MEFTTSIFDRATGPVAALIPPAGVTIPDHQPRVRMVPELEPRLRVWLTRASRVHAALSCVVRLYSNPDKAGGQSNAGDEHVARARRQCKTLLFDALTFCQEELEGVRGEILKQMESAVPTHHPPGTGLKVETMRQRFHDGDSLFQPGDAPREA